MLAKSLDIETVCSTEPYKLGQEPLQRGAGTAGGSLGLWAREVSSPRSALRLSHCTVGHQGDGWVLSESWKRSIGVSRGGDGPYTFWATVGQ